MPTKDHLHDLAELPDEARLWVFPLDRPVSDEAASVLLRRLTIFSQGWVSHGHPVPSAVSIIENQVIVVAARIDDSTNGGVSGCGIDSMVEAVDEATESAGAQQTDALKVLVRHPEGRFVPLTRAEIRRLAREAEITAETEVVVTTHQTLGELRDLGVIQKVADSWVRSLLPQALPA